MKLLNSSINTTVFTRSYLEFAWTNRSQLSEYERAGFAIFFYTTLFGHIEACLAEVIENRLISIRVVNKKLRDDSFSWKNDPEQAEYPTLPIYESIESLILTQAKQIEKAPINSLSESFQQVFNIKLSSLLGEYNKDLLALRDLRNVFAHGRDLWLEFNQDDENSASLNNNPLHLPAQRLLNAGIIQNLNILPSDHHEFRLKFFSDEVMLYFLGCAKEIEKKTKSALNFKAEDDYPLLVSLPDLVV